MLMFIKNIGRSELQKFCFSIIAGCYFIYFVFFSFFISSMNPSNIDGMQMAFPENNASITKHTLLKSDSENSKTNQNPDVSSSYISEKFSVSRANLTSNTIHFHQENSDNMQKTPFKSNTSIVKQNPVQENNFGNIKIVQNPNVSSSAVSGGQKRQNETNNRKSDHLDQKNVVRSRNDTSIVEKLSMNKNVKAKKVPTNVAAVLDEKRKMKQICDFSSKRTNICEMEGDIRIHGASSTVIYATTNDGNESWKIKPYARKFDKTAMGGVRELTVKSSRYEELSNCSAKHDVPGIIFSTRGYLGNFFHDFSDVIIPLFLTSHQYNGEVQFLVTNLNTWWTNKYKPIFASLSNYNLIDFDNDNKTRCFRNAIVGLHSHKDLTLIPSNYPNGYSMVDFTKFLKRAYSLKKISAIKLKENMKKKPRLLIVSRKWTRKLKNVGDIVAMARRLGFKTIVSEAGEGGVANFARIVNSCDVLMGVHGAGLTNILFLPINSVFIQITPWGKLDWLSRVYYEEPAADMKLKYIEYSIKEEESTLIDMFSRNHTVFKNPSSLFKKYGWNGVREVFLEKQDVRLDSERFKGILLEAMKLLHDD